MFHIQTKDSTLLHTVETHDVPDYIIKDSKFFSILTDADEEDDDDDDEDVLGKTFDVMVNDIYFKKALEYYNHYRDYFTGKVVPTEDDYIQVVTRAMVNNVGVLAKRDAERKIVRRNDIPTEVFYMDIEKPTYHRDKQRLELANEQSMLNLDEFTEKWMNEFEREFVKDFHWIAPKSFDYPKETDGVLTVNENDPVSGATIPKQKLSIKRMIDYCGFHMKEVQGERGLLQFQSLGKFLNQWVRTHMASKTPREVCEMSHIPYEGGTDEEEMEKIKKKAKEYWDATKEERLAYLREASRLVAECASGSAEEGKASAC